MPTNEVPNLSLDEARDHDALEASQLEQLHNEIVAHIHPDLENSATVALAAASSAADAAAAIAASDAQQQLARQVMSLGGVDVDVTDADVAQTPPYHLGEEVVSTPGGATGGVSASGKTRSKVSRACDECRRKKVCQHVVWAVLRVTSSILSIFLLSYHASALLKPSYTILYPHFQQATIC
jgi:hypothetical protein